MHDKPLLAPDEPQPVYECCRTGDSRFVIVVDHASARIPRALGKLGVAPEDLQRHIAWDIGALAVAKKLSAALEAPLVAQNYSRLVIDCNRDPQVDSSIPRAAEVTAIPGNSGLSSAQVLARRRAIFDPYHDHIRTLLDERQAAGLGTIFVAQHTMTDVFNGKRRDMHAAVLYNRDRRFAALVLEILRRESGLLIADNEPYFLSDVTDYTIPRHAETRGLPYVEIEVRQDLVSDAVGQDEWARRLTAVLREAEHRFLASA